MWRSINRVYTRILRTQQMRGMLYLDLDNFPATAPYEKALEEFNTHQDEDLRILGRKAFGDLDQLKQLPLEAQQSHNLIPCPKLTKVKNSTDMRLAVELMRDLLTNSSIDMFFIASADSDYIPVMKEIKEKGKEVVLLVQNNANVSTAMTEMADQIIVCESTKPKRDKHSRAKIQDLLHKLFSKSKESVVPISGINDYFVNHGYNFKAHGYTTFKQCLTRCIDSAHYEIDFDEGTLTAKSKKN